MLRARLVVLLLLATAPVARAADPVSETSTAASLQAREDDLLARVRAFDPERYQDLVRLRTTDRGAYWVALARVARLVDRESAPSVELRAQVARVDALRQRYPQGLDHLSAADDKVVRAEFTDIGTRIFDIRQAERRARIESIRAALADLQADVARRDQDRAALIQAFVDKVMRGSVDL